MKDLKHIADDAHGRIVEALLLAGFFSLDEAKNRETFDRVHLVVWQTLHEAMSGQRDQLIDEFATILVRDRDARAERFRRMTDPTRS